MQIIIESPRIRISEKLTTLVRTRLEGIGKVYDRINQCKVVLRKEKNDMQLKCIVSANMNLPRAVLFGEDRAESFEIAIDKVVRDLEHQLQKHKQKLEEKDNSMHIEINDNISLREIQEVFSAFYPYLKLEFYDKPHKKYEASEWQNYIDPGIQVGNIKTTHVTGMLEILPQNRVSQLESEFQQRFGLYVQVLRKEKDGWEQTTGADDFTLHYLNEMGRNSSDEFIVEDYEEGFENNEEKPDKLF